MNCTVINYKWPTWQDLKKQKAGIQLKVHLQRLRGSSAVLSNIIKPPFVRSSWWVRFTTSSGSSIPANCTPGDFFNSSKCGTWNSREQSHKFPIIHCKGCVIIFFTSWSITSQMCSAMSSFLRMMSRDEDPSSPRKNSDGWIAAWPSPSNCAWQSREITQTLKAISH